MILYYFAYFIHLFLVVFLYPSFDNGTVVPYNSVVFGAIFASSHCKLF